MPYYNVSNTVRTFFQLRWVLLFPFSFFCWSFFYQNKIKKEQFLRAASCGRIYRLYRGFTKQKWFCNKVRTFLQLGWFLLFPFSFFFRSFFCENKKQRKINFSDPLYESPLKRFYPGFTKQIGVLRPSDKVRTFFQIRWSLLFFPSFFF